MFIANALNSFVNFFIAALVVGGYRVDVIVIEGSKLCASVLTLLLYLSTSWLRSSYFFVCSGAEIVGLVKSRNFCLIFAMLIALSVSFFISMLLQLSLNSNSELDSSFRAIYRGNLLIYS